MVTTKLPTAPALNVRVYAGLKHVALGFFLSRTVSDLTYVKLVVILLEIHVLKIILMYTFYNVFSVK